MPLHPSRRAVLAGLSALPLSTALARAETLLDAADFGVVPGSLDDQTARLQAALDSAGDRGLPLTLPGGQIVVDGLELRAKTRIVGVPGSTVLATIRSGSPIARGYLANDLTIEGITFSGPTAGGAMQQRGLLEVEGSFGVHIENCTFLFARSNALMLENSGATVLSCAFEDIADTAIFSSNGRAVFVSGCRITRCGSAGIRVWRDEPGEDGARISGNAISAIDWVGGGNGQNGNGINVFRADGVIVEGNRIDGCAFTAVRLNATRNTQVRGNTCTNSGEVAIFSEFGFSGSVIADNIVDGAAGGISMTNFDQDGRLAACTGNIVRNILPRSQVNPDTTPFGIHAEADAVVSGNTVESVPGVGIGVGWGPYLRDVLVTGNLVRDADIGIGVSVAEGTGAAIVSGNLVSGARRAGIAAMAWTEMRSDDLVRDAAQFPTITLDANRVT